MRLLTEPFQYAFFTRGLAAGAVVGTLCGALGCYVLLRRMAYLGQGLSYGVLGGVAIAAAAGANPYAGATIGTFLSAAIIDRLRRTSGLGADTTIAIVSTTAFAIGVALVSADRTLDVNLDELLYGNILGVRAGDVAVAGLAAAVIGIVLVCMHKSLVFVTHDPDAASAAGVRAGAYELLLTVLIAAAVIVSLRVVGVLLVTAALVLPASIARLACRTLGVMLLVSAATGCVMSVIGLYLSYHADIASGPAIVLTGTTGLLATGAVQAIRRRLALAAGRRAPVTAGVGA